MVGEGRKYNMPQQNIALNKPTSSSSYVKPFEPARAVNGTYGISTPTSRWVCNSLPGYLMVDLGVNGSYAYFINRWVVRHMSVAGWRAPDYNMSDFKLQGSNNATNWVDIDAVVGNTVGTTDRTFSAVGYRYVRVYITKGLICNTALASIMELEVYQSPPLSAYLQSGTGLVISSLALSPSPFVNNVFNYTTQSVANSVTSVAVTPTTEDSRATVKVNGTAVTSGSSTNVALNVGSNTITVQVTAADGLTANTYTVTVVRDAGALLSGLSINTTATAAVMVPYSPGFSQDITAYSASVGYDVAQITVTPTTNNAGDTITVNGTAVTNGTASGPIALNVGNSNVVNIVVTNGSTSKAYAITLTRASSPYLIRVDVTYYDSSVRKNVTKSIDINKTTYEYSLDISNNIISITITGYTEDTNAKILVNNNQTLSNGQTSSAISITVGTTRIPLTVTSNTGTDNRSYGVTLV